MKRIALIAMAALAGAAPACGSSDDEPDPEAAEVVKELQELQDLKRGEVVIKGLSAPRVYGPYTVDAGTYRLRFEHGAAGASPGRLVVALQTTPQPASRGTVVVDSRRARGTESVSITGKLFVNVKQARASYALRFTPSP